MSGIVTYPVATPATDDLLLGTKLSEDGNLTKNFTVDQVIQLAGQTILNGASGYFESRDLKGITVVNGLITSIVEIG